jgi:peptidoglycan/xylan/chitin deacetylase (PgdA/CDA1 family)
MPLKLPQGKRIAVAIGADFDAHSLWMGMFNRTSPSYLSRGEFGAEVGVPRLLELFRRFDVKATFFTPGHTLVTFPARVEQIIEAGHEIGAHGCYHELITSLEPDEERELMDIQLQQHDQIVGKKPRGYRSPAWDFSEITLQLLEQHGFEWDSSLMGRDFEPYHPCPVRVNWKTANEFGPPSPILEIPVSWYLDDAPPTEYIAGFGTGLGSHELLYTRWSETFDYGRTRAPGGVLALTIHPFCSGRSHHMLMLERLLEYMSSFDDAWFATMSEVYECWEDGDDAEGVAGDAQAATAGR